MPSCRAVLVQLVLLLALDDALALAARTPPRRGGLPRRSTPGGRRPSAAAKKKGASAPFGLEIFGLAKKKPPPSPPRFSLFGPPPSPPPSPLRLSLDDALESAKDAAASIKPLQVASGFALAVVLASSAVVSTGQAISGFLAEDGNGEVLERTLKFGTILENVKAAYVDGNVDLDALFERSVNSMLATLDPYSAYENADAAEDLALRTTGRYGGVGLTIGKDDKDNVLVLGALEGFAFDAGVRPGDRIQSVDGKPVSTLSVDAVKTMLRGEPGTSITITVQRDGSPEPSLSMLLRRQLVRLPDVTLASVDREGVGYIKLEGFSEGTAEEMARAYRRMQSERELSALVLDMRDNPGGLLDAAVAVAQQIVPEGTEIVSTAGRVYGEGTSLSYRSTKPPLLSPRTRLVVLVNSNTASAAEIVTGVVQDTDRGVVVGERTFGKGLVQVVEPLPGGGSLKLTVAKYYTPSGRCIQAVSYGGGRLEAKAKTGKAAASAVDAGAADVGSPATDGDVTPVTPPPPPAKPSSGGAQKSAPGKSAPGKSAPGGAKKSGDGAPAGAMMRIDPLDPSKPQASAEEEKVEYVTANGRAVKAGGGIAPDMVVEARPLGELERSLLQRGLFFDFAGEWLKKHAAPIDVLANRVDLMQDDAYREFVAYVRNKVAEDDGTLEPAGLQRQLDALQKSIGTKTAAGGSRERSLKELASLRRQLNEEQLDQFRTQKVALRQDVVEALLGRLTPPSVRLAAQLGTDPQVEAALGIAKDIARYDKVLEPDASIVNDVTTNAAGRKIVRRRAPSEASPTALIFPTETLASRFTR